MLYAGSSRREPNYLTPVDCRARPRIQKPQELLSFGSGDLLYRVARAHLANPCTDSFLAPVTPNLFLVVPWYSTARGMSPHGAVWSMQGFHAIRGGNRSLACADYKSHRSSRAWQLGPSRICLRSPIIPSEIWLSILLLTTTPIRRNLAPSGDRIIADALDHHSNSLSASLNARQFTNM